MIRINLLPYRKLRKTENVRRQISIFFGLLAIIIVGLFYYSVILANEMDELNTNLANLQSQLAIKKKLAQEVDEITKKLEDLKKKTEVITQLAALRKEPVKLMAAMTELVVPKQMWLTSLTSAEVKVDVIGVALDNRTVAEFMTKVEESPLFEDVKLISTQQTKVAENNLKTFTLTFNKTLAKAMAAASAPATGPAKGGKP